ncbi:MAG: EAL domain-containing protein [Clostridiaceae bacterium]|nr:EAL domain-containing protein [Clostridiaceae bacterium]
MSLKATKENLRQEYFNILKKEEITTSFQPILSLKNSDILGYEALSRGPANSYFHPPHLLFDYAKKINKIWELDLLCRLKAIERSKKIIGDKLLFINIDPNVINDPTFKRGLTKDYLQKHDLDTMHIVLELTEHTAVNDYKTFNEVLKNYRQQGYRIAVDDAGDGYSGLRLMTEIHPSFIKIDMSLIRNIDKDMIKKELLKSFQRFSQITNIQLIAEGIETYDELRTLIEIGIPYGQGYYLQRPCESFVSIPEGLVEEIHTLNLIKKEIQYYPDTISLGSLNRSDPAIQHHDTCSTVHNIFSTNYNLQGIVVLKQSKPIGLIMRNKFYFEMERDPHKDNFLSRPLRFIMDHTPLILDYSTDIKQASTFAISREESSVYDYIIVTKEQHYIGVVPIAYLLDAFTQNEIKTKPYRN